VRGSPWTDVPSSHLPSMLVLDLRRC